MGGCLLPGARDDQNGRGMARRGKVRGIYTVKLRELK